MEISIIFMLTIFYLRRLRILTEQHWDIKNVTVDDYSVEINLEKHHWKAWLEHCIETKKCKHKDRPKDKCKNFK